MFLAEQIQMEKCPQEAASSVWVFFVGFNGCFFLKNNVLETAPNQRGNMKGPSSNRLNLFFSFPNHEIMQ